MKMIGLIFLGILIAVILLIIILIGWGIGSYNTFIIAVQDIKTQFSNIKTEYQRRADLFMNLVESVKSYAKFEKATLTEVIQARQGNFGTNKKEQMGKMKGLDGIFSKLAVVVEKYPELKAVEQYNSLMAEIKMTENRINIARTDYNSLVRDYNILVSTFPKVILANWFHFQKEVFFENDAATDKAPKIDMNLNL